MKTKLRILETALALFNRFGFVNVTLREVSAVLNISYGNVTYHYPNKEQLLTAIYQAYVDALVELSDAVGEHPDKLLQMLAAPAATFALSLKYRFLFVDYLELQRQYPDFMAEVHQKQQQRKQWWKAQLFELQQSGILRQDMGSESFDFLMELSGLVRTFFFLHVPFEVDDWAQLQQKYVQQVNAVIWPYLTENGLQLAKNAGYFNS